MNRREKLRVSRLATPVALLLLTACTGVIDAPSGETGTGPSGSGGPGSGGSSGTITQATPEECASAPVEPGPSPLRRLTRSEYDNTTSELLGVTSTLGTAFPAEELAQNFPNNATIQTVSSLLIENYETAANQLADDAVKGLPALLGCDPATQGEDACVQAFIPSFGVRAYRRPLTDDESARLTKFYTDSKAA
ncbi:MAG TPA: DUF1587 domain-containing protein, partial [Polyangiaceae bacterium]|nr:DUF1587 domain-containing protein [Polyangiaceae bacterium]